MAPTREGMENCNNIIWILLIHALLLHSFLACAEAAVIGVCDGRLGNDLPQPREVVNLLKSNNIGKYRIYAADHPILQAFENSGIEIIVAVTNDQLPSIAQNPSAADAWVSDNIRRFPGLNIKYIAVGNEVLAKSNPNVQYLLPAMKSIQTAIRKANLQDKIKVSTAHATTVLGKSYPPSAGAFGDQVQGDMKGILDFLAANGSPFMASVYPYFSYVQNSQSIALDYALFRSASPVMVDNGLNYQNLFDAIVDSLIAAMEKLGHPNIPIVITESGWPSAGGDAATVDNAQTYNNNLIKHVLSNQGTPKRPGRSIDTYIFALFNENQKPLLKPGDETERHFGLFYPSKAPVYPVKFQLVRMNCRLILH